MERKDIEEYCKVHNLNPRIDESNLENIYTRNKIRLELIPYMTDNFNSYFPQFMIFAVAQCL